MIHDVQTSFRQSADYQYEGASWDAQYSFGCPCWACTVPGITDLLCYDEGQWAKSACEWRAGYASGDAFGITLSQFFADNNSDMVEVIPELKEFGGALTPEQRTVILQIVKSYHTK